jgi:hypothetical protein
MSTEFTNKHKPSWLDKVMDWLERLPLPLWVTYILMYLLSAIIVWGMYLIEGVENPGEFRKLAFINGFWIPIGLGALHYLNIVGRRAMIDFRPAMDCTEDEYTHLQYQMTRMPKRVVLMINGVMAALFISVALDNPANLDPVLSKPLPTAIVVIYMIIAFSFFAVFFYHTIRQLRLVSRMYGLVKSVNIFNLQPLYTLSGLTAKTGIVWILFINLNYFINLTLGQGPLPTQAVILVIFVELVFAVLVFLLPLWGIHVRIQDEKECMLEENGERLRSTNFELHQHLDANDLSVMDAYQKGISALISLRAEIEKTPTWPWQPATLRGFLSAVFLPIILFVIQQLLLVGFFEF